MFCVFILFTLFLQKYLIMYNKKLTEIEKIILINLPTEFDYKTAKKICDELNLHPRYWDFKTKSFHFMSNFKKIKHNHYKKI